MLEFREFEEDSFRFMEVQVCDETKTVQVSCFDHGGDHPTAPAVAIDWKKARDMARWILDHIGDGDGTLGDTSPDGLERGQALPDPVPPGVGRQGP